jgi:hypothetical protein
VPGDHRRADVPRRDAAGEPAGPAEVARRHERARGVGAQAVEGTVHPDRRDPDPDGFGRGGDGGGLGDDRQGGRAGGRGGDVGDRRARRGRVDQGDGTDDERGRGQQARRGGGRGCAEAAHLTSGPAATAARSR